MPFKASVHGWPFPNALTPDASVLGLGAPPGPELGLGAGMCWAALDRYLGGVDLPRDVAPPEPGDPLYTELLHRNAAALSGLWPRVREWQGLPDREVGFRSRATWRWLRDQLTGGEPVLLTILPEADPYRRAHAAAHVLATGCTVIEDRVLLAIYDPARPGDDDVHLAFSLVGPPHARMVGGRTIRGFFPVPYDRSRPAAEHLESFADRRVLESARPVHGKVAVAAGGASLDLVARSREGGLLHFRRRRRGRWQAQVLMAPDGSGLDEIQGDPAVVTANGRVHAFARTYVGDLLHFQRGLRWTAVNRTAHEHTGPRFRLVGQPVVMAVPTGGVSVFGRDASGAIVHYSGSWRGRWTAERLAGDPIVGDPLAARIGGTLHLFGIDADGRPIHWEREEDEWISRDIVASGQWSPTIRLSSRPVPLVHEDSIYLFGRDVAGRLVHVRRSSRGHWHSVLHPVDIAGTPAVVAGPGGIHIFAAGADGGLVHRWGETVWHGEDLARSRPGLDLPGPPAGTLHAWGSPEEMRVFGRWGGELMVLTWREDADWTAIALRDRAGIDAARLPSETLVMAVDARGLPHLFGTDGRNGVVHLEQGPWIEPAPRVRVAKREAPRPAASDITTPVPAPKSQPAAKADPAAKPDLAAKTEPAAKPAVAAKAEPAAKPTVAAKPAVAGKAEPAGKPAMAAKPAAAARAEQAGKPAVVARTEPAEKPDLAVASVPAAQVEPMDLSLLESWPEPPRNRRSRLGEPHQ